MNLDEILSRVPSFLDQVRLANGTRGIGGDALERNMVSLKDLRLDEGSVVLIALPNSIETLAIFFATLVTGHVPVLANPALPDARLRGLAATVGARLAVTAKGRRPWPRARRTTLSTSHALSLLDANPSHEFQRGDLVLLTSGTSGFYSGCVNTLERIALNAAMHVRSIHQTRSDRVLAVLPFYFSYGLVAQVMAALVTECELIASGPPFTPGELRQLIRTHGVSVTSITPTMARMILREGQGGGSLPVRALTVGGGALDGEDVAELLHINKACELYVTYGLTEAGPRVSTLAAHAEPSSRYGSVGVPLQGVHVEVMDTKCSARRGQLVVSSPTVMKRRLGLVEGKKPGKLGPDKIDTGDIFEIDDDNYLYMVGRNSDFIVCRGEKVCLASVRRAAETIPGVVSAKTRVQCGADGDTSFILDILMRTSHGNAAASIRNRLSKLLLAAERPSFIHVREVGEGALK